MQVTEKLRKGFASTEYAAAQTPDHIVESSLVGFKVTFGVTACVTRSKVHGVPELALNAGGFLFYLSRSVGTAPKSNSVADSESRNRRFRHV